MVRLVDGLDQCREFAIHMEEVDAMRPHGFVIVGLHWLGLPADQGNPFGIGLPRQRADGWRIACLGAPHGHGLNVHALNVPDLPPDLCTSFTSEITMPRSTDLHIS